MSTDATCVGCGEPILSGQSVIRLSAGLLLPPERFDPLIMRPDVYLHAGGGFDTRYEVEDRWCVTEESLWRAIGLLRVHGETSASGH